MPNHKHGCNIQDKTNKNHPPYSDKCILRIQIQFSLLFIKKCQNQTYYDSAHLCNNTHFVPPKMSTPYPMYYFFQLFLSFYCSTPLLLLQFLSPHFSFNLNNPDIVLLSNIIIRILFHFLSLIVIFYHFCTHFPYVFSCKIICIYV